MDYGMSGQVAVVTGGGNGLGEKICKFLAKEGCLVAVWDVDKDAAGRVAGEIIADGGEAIAISGDVSRRASVGRCVQKVLKKFGKIHILVNNAGFSRDAPLIKMTDAQWDSVVDVSLKGAFLVSQAVAPQMMRRKHGRIINMSSRAHLGDPMKANYSAAKAGLLGLTGAMAIELGPYNITVNSIAPGMIRTKRVKALKYFAQIEERSISRTLIRRAGEPEDVASMVAYLASAGASWITGEVLYVSGGRHQ